MAYRPTSLDFINHPNPVEPQSAPQKHPLNGPLRLEQSTKDAFLPLLKSDGKGNIEPSAKRRKSREPTLLDLPHPQLPAVKGVAKRLRIPPTLSGLHEPPPNAGLLPSISVQQPPSSREEDRLSKVVANDSPSRPADQILEQPKSPRSSSKPLGTKRNKWSEEETAQLLKGVSRFGIGSWTAILKCPEYTFHRRTALDLKDRFRVCCPEYTTRKNIGTKRAKVTTASTEDEGISVIRTVQKSSAELVQLGISEPFEKSKRRPRTVYTEEEDAALLRGFHKYGKSWASIQNDPALGLSMRKPTDLRDRLRTKFPDHYRDAGLAPRPEVFPRKPDRQKLNHTAIEETVDHGTQSTVTHPPRADDFDPSRTQKEVHNLQPAKVNPPPTATSFLHNSDVFWGAELDDSDYMYDRPTLDRRILDWPFDATRAATNNNSIDPLVTVKPPAPQPLPGGATSRTSVSNQMTSITTGAALPSLAAITASTGDYDFSAPLELPTLVGIFGSLEDEGVDARGHFPSLEELLS